MAVKFPKTLYARIEEDDDIIIADSDLSAVMNDDDVSEIGVYELVRKTKYRTVVQELP